MGPKELWPFFTFCAREADLCGNFGIGAFILFALPLTSPPPFPQMHAYLDPMAAALQCLFIRCKSYCPDQVLHITAQSTSIDLCLEAGDDQKRFLGSLWVCTARVRPGA